MLLVITVAYTAIVVQVSMRQRAANRAEVVTQEWMPSRRRLAGQVGADLMALLLGIAVVVLGADWLVRGASSLARDLGVSDALIGLTVVAIGTSAPELATTLVSTIRNNREIAIGNLIGSSVYNIAFILGVTVLVAPISIGGELVRVDLPLMATVALVCLLVFRTGHRVSRTEGAVFVVLYLTYLVYLVVART